MDDSSITQDEQDATRYEPPTVTDFGDLADITAGTSGGTATDRAFPIHTPRADLTFS